MGPPEVIAKGGLRDSSLIQDEKRDEPDTVHSLGEALAGMKMGTSTPSSTSGLGLAGVSSTAFSLAPGIVANDKDTWGGFTDASQVAFSSSNGHLTVNGKSASVLENNNHKSSQMPGGGLELFLSQSPSRALGDDVFKLSHPNLPALNNEAERSSQSTPSTAFRYSTHNVAPGPGSSLPFGEIRPAQTEIRRRSDSPPCSVTGTTTSSRSVSPYTQHSNADIGSNSRTIQAFQRYDAHAANELLSRKQTSFAEDERSSPGFLSLSNGHGSHPSLTTIDSAHRSPYSNDRTPQGAIFRRSVSPRNEPVTDLSSPPHIQHHNNASVNTQVLYMAVPSPDGRGQVLQPVQMVQLPGKPYHFVSSIGNQVEPAQQMMNLPPLANQNGIDYQGSVAADARILMDGRSRVGSYNNDSRSYPLDTPSPSSREDYICSGVSSPFPVDAAVASLYAAPQRPPLDALLGQVRRLSRDQVGCRLVQQALDEEGPVAATLILNEGLPFWGEAMVDPFGNYLFQKILEKVTVDERIMLIRTVGPRLVNASLNLHGTRSVQKVVELCSQDEQMRYNGEESAADILTAALSPAAARLCIDSHGNHVIQRILLKLSPKHSKFVFDAVAESVGDVARHRHGCCVIQRCLDSPPTEARANLVRRIVDKSLELMQDAYGNYVVQYVLDVCSDDDVYAVCESVAGKVTLLAIQKFSSNVMEKCLERCSDRIKEMYLQELSDPERIRELMMDPFGNYVVQRALSVATHSQAIRLVEAMRPHLLATQMSGPQGQRNGSVRNTAGGRRIIAKICKRFPNFSLNCAGSQEEIYSSHKGGHRHHSPNYLLHHNAPPIVTAYPSSVGAPVANQHYTGDVHLTQGLVPIQQQQQQSSFYSSNSSPFYEHRFNGGRGGYSGI